MTQLVYHPAFDPYHTILRVFRLLSIFPQEIDVTTLRILDFLLLFPEHLVKVRLTPQLRSNVRRLKPLPRFPYDRLPEARVVFDRMEAVFSAAVQTVVAKGLATATAPSQTLRLQNENISPQLRELVSSSNVEESELLSLLASIANAFPLTGKDGLKARTLLAEFRYDLV